MTRFEHGFEVVLWNSRLLMLIAVVASLAVALAMCYVTTVDIVSLVPHLSHYHDLSLSPDARVQLRGTIVAHVALDLPWLGLGIALVSGALVLSHRAGKYP